VTPLEITDEPVIPWLGKRPGIASRRFRCWAIAQTSAARTSTRVQAAERASWRDSATATSDIAEPSTETTIDAGRNSQKRARNVG